MLLPLSVVIFPHNKNKERIQLRHHGFKVVPITQPLFPIEKLGMKSIEGSLFTKVSLSKSSVLHHWQSTKIVVNEVLLLFLRRISTVEVCQEYGIFAKIPDAFFAKIQV